MKKKIIIIILALIVLFIGYFVFMSMTWVARTEEKGNRIITLIEAYKTKHSTYPKDLSAVGIPFNNTGGWEYQGETFYYDNMGDGTYMLYFILNFDENDAYHSLLKTWMHSFYTDLIYERKAELLQHVHELYAKGQVDSTAYDSVGANIKRIKQKDCTTIPDSVAYQRDYYSDGHLAGEGWITFFSGRRNDFTNRTGEWTFYTKDGIAITENY